MELGDRSYYAWEQPTLTEPLTNVCIYVIPDRRLVEGFTKETLTKTYCKLHAKSVEMEIEICRMDII